MEAWQRLLSGRYFLKPLSSFLISCVGLQFREVDALVSLAVFPRILAY